MDANSENKSKADEWLAESRQQQTGTAVLSRPDIAIPFPASFQNDFDQPRYPRTAVIHDRYAGASAVPAADRPRGTFFLWPASPWLVVIVLFLCLATFALHESFRAVRAESAARAQSIRAQREIDDLRSQKYDLETLLLIHKGIGDLRRLQELMPRESYPQSSSVPLRRAESR